MSSNEKLNEMLHIMMDNIMEDFQALSDENNAKIDEMQKQITDLSLKIDNQSTNTHISNNEDIKEMFGILNKNVLCMNTLLTQIHNKISIENAPSPRMKSNTRKDNFSKTYIAGSDLSELSDVDSTMEYKIEQNLALENASSQIIVNGKDVYIVCDHSYIDRFNITKNGNITLNNDGCEHWMVTRNKNDAKYKVHNLHTVNCLGSHYSFEYIIQPDSNADFVWNDNTWCNHGSQKRFVILDNIKMNMTEYNYKRKSYSSFSILDVKQTPYMIYSDEYIITYNNDIDHLIFNIIKLNGTKSECRSIGKKIMDRCNKGKCSVSIDSVHLNGQNLLVFTRFFTLNRKNIHGYEYYVYHVNVEDINVTEEYNTNIKGYKTKWNDNDSFQLIKSNGKTRIIAYIHGCEESYINSKNILSKQILEYLDVDCNDYNNEYKSMDTDKTTSQEVINKLFTSEKSYYESSCIYDQYVVQFILDNSGKIAYMKKFTLSLFYPIMNACALNKNQLIITSYHERHTIESLLSFCGKHSQEERIDKRYNLQLVKIGKWKYEYFY